MFTVKWDYTCYECCCPMGVKLVLCGDDTFFRDFGSWAYLKPYHLYMNTSIYKFYGLRLRRVCISCYFNPKRVNIRDRETGIKRVVRGDEERSKSYDDIKEYFEDFVQFRQRKDLDMCLVDEWKQMYVGGLDIYLLSPNY